MKRSFRSSLFLTVLILVVVVISAVFLKSKLYAQFETEANSELLHYAKAMRELILAALGENSVDSLDSLVDRFGKIISSRITVIAPDGTLLGDSELSGKRILEAENLPEVLEALSKGQGSSRRYSASLKTDILYVAVPFQHENGLGVVRIAKPLHEVNLALARLRLLLFHIIILGLGIAALVGIFTFRLMSSRLRNLLGNAKTLAEKRMRGQSHDIVFISSKGEIGKLAGSVNRMVSELERLMSSLAQERDYFEAVLESMEEGILALDENRRITHANPALLSLLGLSAVPGRMLSEVIRSPDLNELVSKAAETNTVEFELPGRDSRRLQATVTPQHATGGTVVVMRDVTELRHLEAVRRDFIENASHELRTPVSVIQANAETLLKSALEGQPCALEFLEALQRNSERLSSIINDLLDISQIERGRYILDFRAIRIEDVASKIPERVQARTIAKRLTLEADLKPNLLVLADAKALDQALYNLVDNAVKYTPEGGHILVRARRTGDRVRIEVCDDGYGIEPKHQDRIFERFYRVDTSRSRELGGTGLGLSIVKNLTEAMNGQVGLNHGHPHGSVFWMTLPAMTGGHYILEEDTR
ncbi:Phosphate regulon sensor protein PhoR (SphS) [Olavius algarvensis spirochete endosymbiont]|uniref:sensor histidine kinase n=1 Tax=Olavius algarvensis spirochete endosymbiont TaxID=260710 RepID=UPI000F285E9F|nr:ATP-binding protein [Olavius algarvensis spirochete endosymbiont]CAD7843743.1 MAG: hypothetical protein [Olavius algarvensis spirochete endosymbiont]VDB00453.1 Phosphate regulon sensor protein PhoR (SphS) [Olavius algarvensis spirochete endosymbiont]